MTAETILADILSWQSAAAIVIVLAAGVVRGFTGFGSALVMVPVLAYLWSPAEAVAVALFLGIVGSFQLVPKAVPLAGWRDIGPMAAATLLFTPLGTLVLVGVAEEPVRKIIAGLILAITLVMLRGWQYSGPRGPLPGAVAGAVGAVINGIAGIGGPAAVLYLMSLKDEVATQRANIVLQVAFMGVVSASYLVASGVLGVSVAIYTAALAVPMLVGTSIGGRLFLRLPAAAFRRIVMWLLLVMSAVILVF